MMRKQQNAVFQNGKTRIHNELQINNLQNRKIFQSFSFINHWLSMVIFRILTGNFHPESEGTVLYASGRVLLFSV